MKTQVILLACCLLGSTLANAQNATTTTTTTTVNSSPVADTTTTTINSPSNAAVDSTSSMNKTGSYSTTPTNSYNSTTTTTTSTNSLGNSDNQPQKDKSWGKEGKFGIYAGVNFSRFVNEVVPDNAYRVGWQAGLYGRSGGTIFGQLGLEYRNSTTNLIRTGQGTTTGSVSNEVRGKIDQHFLAIPAYVGVRIGSALGLRLQVGAELASLVAVGDNNFKLGKDDLNRTILNGLAGAGINLGPLTLDAVYNYGLQNVFDNADTKRRILALNLGLRF